MKGKKKEQYYGIKYMQFNLEQLKFNYVVGVCAQKATSNQRSTASKRCTTGTPQSPKFPTPSLIVFTILWLI
jgi:hypothetical protein